MKNNNKKCIIITSIHPKNQSLEKFASIKKYDLIIVGDKKSPSKYDLNAVYLDIKTQNKLFPAFSNLLPFNHYSRKNMGYIYAIANGYEVIAESDDDNFPYKNWGLISKENIFSTITKPKFPNVYKIFTDKQIWPRGFPLDLILKNEKIYKKSLKTNVLIWQGLVDDNTDVDAIYRLVINKTIKFKKGKTVALARGVLSPFNSQNTIWLKKAFPFLYLPSTVSFRFTDILRSFVAQYGIWKMNSVVAFESPTANQIRNIHDILKDLKDECIVYNSFYKIINILEKCPLEGKISDLLLMYEALLKNKIVKKEEIISVKKWVDIINQYIK